MGQGSDSVVESQEEGEPQSKRDRPILREGSGAFILHACGMGTAFFSQVVLARALGDHDYGHVAYAMAWSMTLGQFCALGLHSSAIREVAGRLAVGDRALALGFIRFSLIVALVIGLLCAGIAAALNHATADDGGDAVFLIAMALVPLQAMFAVLFGQLRGFHQVFVPMASDNLLREGIILLVVACVAVLGWHFTASWAVATIVAALAASVLACLIGLRSQVRRKLAGAVPRYEFVNWLKTSLPMLVTLSAVTALNRVDVIMVGWMIGLKEAGIYAVAARLATVARMPLSALNTVLAPRIAARFAKRDMAELRTDVGAVAKAAFVTALLAVVCGVFLGRPVLSLFGQGFGSGYASLLILLVAQCITASQGSVGFVMSMTDMERSAALVNGLTVVLTITLNWLLIRAIGIEGAALGTSIGLLFRSLSSAMLIRRRHSISFSAMGKDT